MPRIKVESYKNVYGITEITTKEYDLPEKVISPKTGNLLCWDSYHHTYMANRGEECLSAEEYIKLVQKQNGRQIKDDEYGL